MIGAIVLLEADHSLLGRPVQRQVDMRGEFQIGQFSTLGDRLDDFRREKRQPDEASNVGISCALAAGDRSQRRRPGASNSSTILAKSAKEWVSRSTLYTTMTSTTRSRMSVSSRCRAGRSMFHPRTRRRHRRP